MASDFESAFRQLLKSVVQEVASELLIERGSHNRPSVPNPKQADESVIFFVREKLRSDFKFQRDIFKS